MKRLVLSVCLLYTFSGCNTLAGSPKDSLSQFLKAMQNNNYAEAKKYFENAIRLTQSETERKILKDKIRVMLN